MSRPTEIPLARAASLYGSRRYAEAAGSYRAVLSIDPTDRRAYLGLADCAVGRGRLDDAIDELVGAAADFRDREDFDGAFALMARALAIDPERLELHIDVAELEAASGKTEMAIGRLENLAGAYELCSQYEDAAAIHEVIEAWLSAEQDVEAPQPELEPEPEPEPERAVQPIEVRTLVAEAVPVHILSGNTVRAYVAPLNAKQPSKLPAARPVGDLVPGAVRATKTAVTESVLLRKTPPPPPARTVASALPQEGPADQTEPQDVIDTSASIMPKPARRGPRRDTVAPRWCPSTLQGKPMPELPSKKLSLSRLGPPPQPPGKPQRKVRKSVVEPAPSPQRGAIKLEKLPSLSGPKPARTRSTGVPRRTPSKHTALLHPHLPGAKKKEPAKPAVVGKVLFKKVPVEKVPVASARRETPPKQPGPRSNKPSLAERLRQASAGPKVPVAIEIDDEPTRLWAPDHLII